MADRARLPHPAFPGRQQHVMGCPKTLDAGLAQITVGLAWWYRYYAAEQSEEGLHRYEFAEYEARARKAGLWIDNQAAQPRKWRTMNG